MARYVLIALCIFFAAFVMQANSAPAESTTMNSFEEALKTAGDSINKALQDAKPELEEFLAQSQQFFEGVGKKISEEASKIIPSSASTKAKP